ncbi:phage tail protein [Listeria monocytogenes]|uniref:phage tail spike protein n=1 Tax=Listeria monocytogenes TaxID=1639 RepID=UPI00074D5E06|nr:phage tail spike protein [Listeria monocytogenes]EJC5380615.1 phage tail protein [Listeria monocytogenes]EKL6378501.1 phage tail protein [Listeria monocytogenes]MBX9520160.1 phage tail protein [Listeria monocytogenes]MBX9523135.1 phage tail protein [Listeria monocytogenes]MBX9528233.1 phage tail protein [Listeria monocytogenes]
MSYPTLYKADDPEILNGFVPTNNGLGTLTNIANAVVSEERQGAFTFSFTYYAPNDFDDDYEIQKVLFENLKKRAVVKVKVNDFDGEKLFRIDESQFDAIGEFKEITAIAIAQYDLAANSFVGVDKKSITPATALNEVLRAAVVPNKFTAWSDISITSNYKLDYKTVAEAIAGTEGSIIDTWRTELEWDDFTIRLWKNRGTNRGVRIAYAKNLVGLVETETGDVTTRIIPFARIDDGVGGEIELRLSETVIDAENVNETEIPLALPVDFSSEMQDAGYTTEDKLRTLAQAWFEKTGNNIPKISLEVDFVQLAKTEEYKEFAVLEQVALFDTVEVWHERYNKKIETRVNKYTYDPIDELYLMLELGDAKYSLSASSEMSARENAQLADKINGNYSFIEDAIKKATDLITGNSGGYVVLYPPSRPAEIMIMDTEDVTTSKDVLRINKSGIGFSSSGIDGPYETAWTLDGDFNAKFITAGTLRAIDIEGVTITGSTVQADLFSAQFVPKNGDPSPLRYKLDLAGAGMIFQAIQRSNARNYTETQLSESGIDFRFFNNGEIRTERSTSINDLGIETPSIANTGNIYLRSENEARVVDDSDFKIPGHDGSADSYVYRNIRAKGFIQHSTVERKQDFVKYEDTERIKAIDIVKSAGVFEYRLKDDLATNSFDKKIGMLAEMLPEHLKTDGKSIDMYAVVTNLWQYARENEEEKQQMRKEIDELKELVYSLA